MKKFLVGMLFLVMLFNYQILSTDYGLITIDTSTISVDSLYSAINTFAGITSIKYYPNPIGENYFVIITHQSNGYLLMATYEDILAMETLSLLASSTLGSVVSQYNPILVKTIHPIIYLIIMIIIIAAPTKTQEKEIQAEEVPETVEPIQQEKKIETVQIIEKKYEIKTKTTSRTFRSLKDTYNNWPLRITLISVWSAFAVSVGYYIYYSYYIYLRNSGYKDWYIRNSLEYQSMWLQYAIITFAISITFMIVCAFARSTKEKNLNI